MTRRSITGLALVLLASCTTRLPSAPTPQEVQSGFIGEMWNLVEIQSMDDTTYTPRAPNLYTLEFKEEGQVSIRVDCNRGTTTWTFTPPSGLTFNPIASTRAYCGPDSIHDRFLTDLSYVRSFVMREGSLYLATMADGAIMQFIPASPDGGCNQSQAQKCIKVPTDAH